MRWNLTWEKIRRIRIPYFRIWYSTTYSIIFVITLILLAATPGDTIYQSFRNDNLPNVFVIGGVYVLTAAIAILVYATRIYTNKSVLAAIPKSYLPIDHGEVAKSVRKLIVREWERSAIIAWDSRPRDVRSEIRAKRAHAEPSTKGRIRNVLRKRGDVEDATLVHIDPANPPWGLIAHPGWSSPASEEWPHLQYWNVILELPNLIEAKAVSLAPADLILEFQLSDPEDLRTAAPDARVVAALQRPATMGLRDYLALLASYNLINPPVLRTQFLSKYEQARFSGRQITERQFKELLASFNDILSSITSLDPALISQIQAHATTSGSSSMSFSEDSTTTSNASAIRHQTPAQRNYSDSSSTYSSPASRMRSSSTGTVRTAPSRALRSRQASAGRTLRKDPSLDSIKSLSQSQRQQGVNLAASPASTSSTSLASAQSVVKNMHHRPMSTEGVPVHFNFDAS